MAKKLTRVEAKELLNKFKDETNYFDGTIKFDDMYDMFRHRFGFGEAETNVILASLKLCGANFKF